jgi:hypothetical protein
MCWLHGEPTLEDVFSDPTVHTLMERDQVDPDDLRIFLEDVKAGLAMRSLVARPHLPWHPARPDGASQGARVAR